MAIPVPLHEVVDELQMVSNQITTYLNRRTGEFFAWNENEIYPDEDEDLSDCPEAAIEMAGGEQHSVHAGEEAKQGGKLRRRSNGSIAATGCPRCRGPRKL